jgi:hypothetical protein
MAVNDGISNEGRSLKILKQFLKPGESLVKKGMGFDKNIITKPMEGRFHL